MLDPLFWLGLSILLVAVSLTAVLVAALPALQELARAARSAEKLFDTLSRELPPTLESIRLTGMEISDLTDEVNKGVQSASGAIAKVDDSLDTAKKQAQKVQVTTKSLLAGIKAGWNSLTKSKKSAKNHRRRSEPLPSSTRTAVDFESSLSPKRTSDRKSKDPMAPSRFRGHGQGEDDYLPTEYLDQTESDRLSSQPAPVNRPDES